MDIKNTLEVLDTLETLATVIKDVRADGKVNWMDAPKFARLIPSGRKALEDAQQIKLELKEIDEKEAQALVDRLFAVTTALMDALLSDPVKK